MKFPDLKINKFLANNDADENQKSRSYFKFKSLQKMMLMDLQRSRSYPPRPRSRLCIAFNFRSVVAIQQKYPNDIHKDPKTPKP